MMEGLSAISLCTLILRSAAQPQEFFNTTPRPITSGFSCVGRPTGYYADVPSECRAYHVCDDQGNKFSYHCPEMTLFRQEALVCDHAHLVDCRGTETRDGERADRPRSSTSDGSTARDLGRWTTADPFLENVRRDAVELRPEYKTTPKNSGFDYSGVRFGDPAATGTVGLRNHPNNRKWKQNGDRVSVSKGSDRSGADNRTRFDGNLFVGFPGSEAVTNDARTEGDRREESGASRSSQLNPDARPYRKTTATTFATSTEIPFRDFTASLKPLVPDTLEYDPYYPRESSPGTESYYTPGEKFELLRDFGAPDLQPSRIGVYFKIPDVWPDLNTIDDIVDRRKLFFIPGSPAKIIL